MKKGFCKIISVYSVKTLIIKGNLSKKHEGMFFMMYDVTALNLFNLTFKIVINSWKRVKQIN